MKQLFRSFETQVPLLVQFAQLSLLEDSSKYTSVRKQKIFFKNVFEGHVVNK